MVAGAERLHWESRWSWAGELGSLLEIVRGAPYLSLGDGSCWVYDV